MDQAIEVQNYAAVHKVCTLQFECEVGIIANASSNGRNLENTHRKNLIKTWSRMAEVKVELSRQRTFQF